MEGEECLRKYVTFLDQVIGTDLMVPRPGSFQKPLPCFESLWLIAVTQK